MRSYLTICAQSEYFLECWQLVKDNIEAQLAAYLGKEHQFKLAVPDAGFEEKLVERVT